MQVKNLIKEIHKFPDVSVSGHTDGRIANGLLKITNFVAYHCGLEVSIFFLDKYDLESSQFSNKPQSTDLFVCCLNDILVSQSLNF